MPRYPSSFIPVVNSKAATSLT